MKAYKDMIKAIPAHKGSPVFCILKGGKCIPIINKQFQNKLRSLIEKTGRNSKYHSLHSFRKSGAALSFAFEFIIILILQIKELRNLPLFRIL